ncbi:MAG: cytochrome c biogenesis protein CcsA [Marinifilaceae bacterium]
MKKIFDFLFSMQMMGVLTILFALSIGTATFIENDFGTQAARALVYNAKWFELLLILLGANLVANIFRYKLYLRAKWTILAFHVAFIVIILGSGITRYMGYEATMHIREGETSNQILSADTYIDIVVNHKGEQSKESKRISLTSLKPSSFDTDLQLTNKTINVELMAYLPHAEESLQEDPTGQPVIEFVAVGQGGKQNFQSYTLEYKGAKIINNQMFAFNTIDNPNAITFNYSDSLRIRAPYPIKKISMMDGSAGLMDAGVFHSIEPRKLYDLNGTKIVIKNFYPRAKFRYISGRNENKPDMLAFRVSDGTSIKELMVSGQRDVIGTKSPLNLNGSQVSISYGSKIMELPFSIKLIDFQLDRYPGSKSPSSFASEVTLIDPSQNLTKDYRIFMNNILKHRGYRFFQSSYDKDEKGTILSVNHDLLGMMVTYTGYFLMMLGMALSLFNRQSRFKILSRRANEISRNKTVITIALLIGLSGLSLNTSAQQQTSTPTPIPMEQASKFSELLVLDNSGRIEPINTLASEIIRKISKRSKYKGMHSDQVFLGMTSNPMQWQMVPLIKVANSELSRKIGVQGKYAAFVDFLNQKGQYKLGAEVQQAYSKKPVHRSRYEKELINVDERVNICYMVFSGEFLKIFPNPTDQNAEWYKPTDIVHLPTQDSLFVKKSVQMYLQAVNNNDYNQADEFLAGIKTYQKRYGAQILPGETKQKIEILYNNTNIFKRLFPIYLLIGFFLLIALVVHIVQPKLRITWIVRSALILLGIGFLLHTAGLAARWYISGHAPWSNGFESMTYVAWACLLSGFLFVRKSYFSLAATAILGGLTLFVAHLSWMSPEVTNLVPVLKSYWLTIHVAVITASYGFLALGAILGFINLVLMILKNRKNDKRIDGNIADLTTISEMTIIVGLYFLTIGTFLGGIWANESWGRYWGWDPKETWALVSILVYSFVVHMRFIPGLQSVYSFNLASLLGYSSILMTYFGVNYYLAGLHSYAKGDPVPIPTWVYYSVAVVIAVALLAYYNYKKHEAEANKELTAEA